jgi:hypothetical protein
MSSIIFQTHSGAEGPASSERSGVRLKFPPEPPVVIWKMQNGAEGARARLRLARRSRPLLLSTVLLGAASQRRAALRAGTSTGVPVGGL